MKKGCKVIKKKRSIKKILFAVLFCIVGLIIAAILFVKFNVNPVIVSLSNERIRAITNDAVANAVKQVMSEASDRELLKVSRDGSDKITSIEVDAAAVSSLAQDITIAAQNNINAAGRSGIKIPCGSLSGFTVFTGLGPDVNIKIYLEGSTQTKIISEFTTTGINQTLHRLYINITGSVSVAMPGLPSSVKTGAQAVMSETIIVGEVPPTYLHSASMGDMLDLIPG